MVHNPIISCLNRWIEGVVVPPNLNEKMYFVKKIKNIYTTDVVKIL
jgi:hypothetical protein